LASFALNASANCLGVRFQDPVLFAGIEYDLLVYFEWQHSHDGVRGIQYRDLISDNNIHISAIVQFSVIVLVPARLVYLKMIAARWLEVLLVERYRP
jgi:hypothetical protein